MRFIFFLVLGIFLGPSFLKVSLPVEFSKASQLAGGALLFLAGWELRFLGLKEDAQFYFKVFLGAFVLPFVAGYVVFEGNLFLGFAMGISALPVTIQILKEKNLFSTLFAWRVITLASLCDLIPWVGMLFILPSENSLSWFFNHWIVFAFILGLVAGRLSPKKINSKMAWVPLNLLAPLFFVGLGLKINLITDLNASEFLKIALVAILSKVFGGYLSARWAGESHVQAKNYAFILNARGAMEVIAAQFAFQAGLIQSSTFVALVMLGVVTSIMAVPLVVRH